MPINSIGNSLSFKGFVASMPDRETLTKHVDQDFSGRSKENVVRNLADYKGKLEDYYKSKTGEDVTLEIRPDPEYVERLNRQLTGRPRNTDRLYVITTLERPGKEPVVNRDTLGFINVHSGKKLFNEFQEKIRQIDKKEQGQDDLLQKVGKQLDRLFGRKDK